jgi:hypothetical protein
MERLSLYLRYAVAVFALYIPFLYTNYRSVRASDRFYSAIRPTVKDAYALRVALFYDSREGSLDTRRSYTREERNEARAHQRAISGRIKTQLSEFRAASRGFKEVEFLTVDVSARDNDQFVTAFGITTFPEVILFKDGEMFMANETAVRMRGSFSHDEVISASDIVQFVRTHFGSYIQDVIEARVQAKHELARLRAAAPKYYGGPYWYGSWGYPYWRRPYYWGSCYGWRC